MNSAGTGAFGQGELGTGGLRRDADAHARETPVPGRERVRRPEQAPAHASAHAGATKSLAARLRTPGPAAVRAVKSIVFVLALLPLVRLIAGFFLDRLGANPIELITRSTGTWTLTFVLITLSVTPLRRLTGWHWLLKLRRMLGLFAFFYACLHFTTYIWFDQFFDWA